MIIRGLMKDRTALTITGFTTGRIALIRGFTTQDCGHKGFYRRLDCAHNGFHHTQDCAYLWGFTTGRTVLIIKSFLTDETVITISGSTTHRTVNQRGIYNRRDCDYLNRFYHTQDC